MQVADPPHRGPINDFRSLYLSLSWYGMRPCLPPNTQTTFLSQKFWGTALSAHCEIEFENIQVLVGLTPPSHRLATFDLRSSKHRVLQSRCFELIAPYSFKKWIS